MNTDTGEIKNFSLEQFNKLDTNVWMPLGVGDTFEIGKGKFEVISIVPSPHNLMIAKGIAKK